MADPLNSTIASLTSLLGLFTGKKSTVTEDGGTETKQTMLSSTAVQELLRGLMEGNGNTSGLAAVSSAQKAPGLYNSSSRTLMVNDLLAKAAGQVAVAGAPTVTSKTGGTRTTSSPATIDPKTGLLLGAGLLAASPKARKKVGDLLGLGSKVAGSVGTGALAIGADAAQAGMGAGAAATWGGDLDILGSAEGGGSLGDLTSAWEAAFSGADVASSAGDFIDVLGDWGGAADFFGEGTAGAEALWDMGGAADVASGGVPYLAIGNGILNNVLGYDGGVMQAVDDTLGYVGDALDGIFGGCFITTAITAAEGKADNCHELQVLRAYRDGWLQENHPEDIQTYYRIAPAIVASMDTKYYKELKEQYLEPAIAAVLAEENQKAYELYKAMVSKAEEYAALKGS